MRYNFLKDKRFIYFFVFLIALLILLYGGKANNILIAGFIHLGTLSGWLSLIALSMLSLGFNKEFSKLYFISKLNFALAILWFPFCSFIADNTSLVFRSSKSMYICIGYTFLILSISIVSILISMYKNKKGKQ